MSGSSGQAPHTLGKAEGQLSFRSYWTLFVLLLVSIFNFIDRQILYILIEPIRVDLEMSDTQVGLLTGLSFAVVYGLAGLWVARLADRHPRHWIIAASVFVWSAFTALGGLATSYWHLALSRLGVAAGESGSTPASHSLIADIFPPERRAFALAIFAAGTPIGVMIGYVGGGWLATTLSWREALIVVGLPGILLSVLVLMTLKEVPPQRAPGEVPARGAVPALLKLSIFRHMMGAAGLFAASAYALSAFQPSFLIRLHGLTPAEAGLALGLVHGVGGAIGILLGGYLADRLGKWDPRWRQWVPAVGALVSVPLTVAALFVADGQLSALLMAGPAIGGLLYVAPTFALAQTIAPIWARATASALILLAVSLVGQSSGPLLTGILSDMLRETYGMDGLRYALLLVPVLQLWSAVHFWIAGKKIPGAGITS
jgi:predicted MFS family arabinose efflux permease